MMGKYSDKVCCVYDTGGTTELSVRLAKDFGKVYYYTNWKEDLSLSTELRVGFGIPGVERVEDFWDLVDEKKVDIFVFPTIHNGDIQFHLESLGYKVFGSRHGDDIELRRGKAMDLFKKLGLPVIPHVRVTGTQELREYLKKNPDVYVKICKTRGDMETEHSYNYDQIEGVITELEQELGPEKFIKVFTVFQAIDAIEIGYDGFCINGKYPGKTLYGIEIKDAAYLGKFVEYSKLPKQLLHFNEVMSKTLADFEYKNFYAYDIRIAEKDGTAYPSDICSRIPWPSGDVEMIMYKNLADIIWEGSQGKIVDPESDYVWGGACAIISGWAVKNAIQVQFPDKYRDNIKLRHMCMIDGNYWVLPQRIGSSYIGSVVAAGKTKEEVIDKIKEIGKTIIATHIEIPYDAFDKAEKEFKKAESFGIKLF